MTGVIDVASGQVRSRRGINQLVIGGQALPLDDLIRIDLDDPETIARYQGIYRDAKPFPHIVMRDLFNPRLLDLIAGEFPACRQSMHSVTSKREYTLRAPFGHTLGPAIETYISLVHSHRFVRFLSAVTGTPHLIVDHGLRGGGLHETVAGGHFGIHRDFNLHRDTLLANRLVLITYLNHDWAPQYGGALELWDPQTRTCAQRIPPDFGTTVLMGHGVASFHGHPDLLDVPDGVTRKSVAVYYYENDMAEQRRTQFRSSLFLDEIRGSALPQPGRPEPVRHIPIVERAKFALRAVVPPVLWAGASRLRRRRPSRGKVPPG